MSHGNKHSNPVTSEGTTKPVRHIADIAARTQAADAEVLPALLGGQQGSADVAPVPDGNAPPVYLSVQSHLDTVIARYSPGAPLVDRVTEELFATPGIEAIDSCSAEGSFMAQLWAGRRTMVDLLVDVGPGKSLGFALEAGRQRGYHRLRGLRNRLRARSWMPQPKKVSVAASQ